MLEQHYGGPDMARNSGPLPPASEEEVSSPELQELLEGAVSEVDPLAPGGPAHSSESPLLRPEHHGAETGHPHCALPEFLTHRILESDKRAIAFNQWVWDDWLHSNS